MTVIRCIGAAQACMSKGEPLERVLTEAEATRLLEGRDGLLPKKRQYYIETLYSHYAHTMHIEPLDVAGEIIREKYPAFFPEETTTTTAPPVTTTPPVTTPPVTDIDTTVPVRELGGIRRYGAHHRAGFGQGLRILRPRGNHRAARHDRHHIHAE